MDTIDATDYRRLVGAPDRDLPAEMDAVAYRRMLGNPVSASDMVPRRNLDSSRVETETPAKREFAEWLECVSPYPVVAEHRFLEDRKFRADWAIPEIKLLIEFDGVVHHTGVTGAWRDAEKSNLAQIAGWMMIRVNARSLRDGSGYRDAVAAFAARGVMV